MLRCQTHMQPAGWRVGQLRRAVVKTSVASGCVEHVFVRNQQLEFPVTERKLATRADSGGSSENAADHRGKVQYQLFAGAEVIAEPDRSSSQVLIVVASLEMKPPVVSGYDRVDIAVLIGRNVAVDGDGECPRNLGWRLRSS